MDQIWSEKGRCLGAIHLYVTLLYEHICKKIPGIDYILNNF